VNHLDDEWLLRKDAPKSDTILTADPLVLDPGTDAIYENVNANIHIDPLGTLTYTVIKHPHTLRIQYTDGAVYFRNIVKQFITVSRNVPVKQISLKATRRICDMKKTTWHADFEKCFCCAYPQHSVINVRGPKHLKLFYCPHVRIFKCSICGEILKNVFDVWKHYSTRKNSVFNWSSKSFSARGNIFVRNLWRNRFIYGRSFREKKSFDHALLNLLLKTKHRNIPPKIAIKLGSFYVFPLNQISRISRISCVSCCAFCSLVFLQALHRKMFQIHWRHWTQKLRVLLLPRLSQ